MAKQGIFQGKQGNSLAEQEPSEASRWSAQNTRIRRRSAPNPLRYLDSGGQISAPNNTLGLIALPPAPERPLRHAQDLRGLGLAQITPITASVDILELHQSQSLQLLRLSDEINDRHYLIVDALDGRTHYVDIGKGEATEPTPEGAIVRIDPKHPEPPAGRSHGLRNRGCQRRAV